MNTLLWLQRDLRVDNNAALNWAFERAAPIIAVYIHSPLEDAPWSEGAASKWWLHNSLQQLQKKLKRLAIPLHFINADSESMIPALAERYDVDAVVWTNRGEPQRRQIENRIDNNLREEGIQVQRFNDNLLPSPELLLTAAKNTPYLVFTPFYRRLRSQLDMLDSLPRSVTKIEKRCISTVEIVESRSLQQLGLLDQNGWSEKLHQYWTPGEDTALQRLRSFSQDSLENYLQQRDFPALDGTSALSAHLHFGEISPRQILSELRPLLEFHSATMTAAAEGFLRQLIWREFARYILWHFPHTASQPMNSKFDSTFWHSDAAAVEKWQRGKTGIAIVDAGMTQLWETGWMHNRVRMLVASLLTKNLGVHWQQGAKWFWDTLVDADLANNSMGWQWVAGSGVDAAPYFRIFNPSVQASRFDAESGYQDRWLTGNSRSDELTPIVDLKTSRVDALERYKLLGSR